MSDGLKPPRRLRRTTPDLPTRIAQILESEQMRNDRTDRSLLARGTTVFGTIAGGDRR